MRKCVIDQITGVCLNVIMLQDGEPFQPSSANQVLSTRHDGEIGWQLVSGEWVYETPAPVMPTTEQLAAETRAKRNALLAASDWTQVLDAPVDQVAWAVYRQALRDISQQSGFPSNVTWPSKPE